jgi:iduronate 2-sulfatase
MHQWRCKIEYSLKLVFLTSCLWHSAVAQTKQPSPNILWIIADDLNMNLGCYGDETALTPHIDALSASGIRFDRAYTQYTLCNPSRTSFLSGKRPDTTRIWDNATEPRTYLGKDYVFLPEYFHNHGYFTGGAGKIAHFANSLSWDEYVNTPSEPDHLTTPEGLIYNFAWEASGLDDSDMQDGKTARTITQMLQKKRNKPFFIAAGFHKPHLPWVAPKKYFDMHPLSGFTLRPQQVDDLKDIPKQAFFVRESLLTELDWKKSMQANTACVSFLDAQVGLLLAALDSLDLRKNTIVVFHSDHGWLLGEHQGGGYKQSLFEPTAQVPLLVSMPGKPKGQISKAFVELVDIFPTLTDICGLPNPPGMEGISFSPILDSPNRPWKTAVFTQIYRIPGGFNGPEITSAFMASSVRTDRYRFSDWGIFGKELYDEVNDKNEFTNLVYHEANKKLGDSLSVILAAGYKAALPRGVAGLSKSVPIQTPANSGHRFGLPHYRIGENREVPGFIVDAAGRTSPEYSTASWEF